MDELFCKICKEEIPSDEDNYECRTCNVIFCINCYEYEENRHEHKNVELIRNDQKMEDKYYYSYTDKITGKKIFLTNHVAADPNSNTLKKNNIKCVITLLNFSMDAKQDLEDELEHIRIIYFQNSKKMPSYIAKSSNGVLYHLVDIPDYSDPTLLNDTHPYLLEEVTCYIDSALKRGNVLIHCRRGERRSPSLLMAWMLTRGIKLDDCINMINKDYGGKYGWGESYRKARPMWLKKLKFWSANYKLLQSKWIEQVNKSYQSIQKDKENQIKN